MSQVFLLVFGALALLGFGAGVGYWFGSGGRQRGRAEELQQELEDYRAQVGEHFAKTAEHFQTIGREYRSLYEHMASGAEALCDRRDAEARLSFLPTPLPGSDREGPAAVDDRDAISDTGEAMVDAENERVEASTDAEGDARKVDAEVAEAASLDDDGTTPESRARASGGESAPHESDDEHPVEPDAEMAVEADAETRVGSDTEKGSADDDGGAAGESPEVLVEESSETDADRTYH